MLDWRSVLLALLLSPSIVDGLAVPGHPLARAGAQAKMATAAEFVEYPPESDPFVCVSRHPLAGTTTIRIESSRPESVSPSPFALMTIPLALSFAAAADHYAAVTGG